MSVPCPVERCDRPRPGDRHVCGACEADLARALGDVPWLVEQLSLTLARQTSRTSGGRSADVSLPYDARAAEAGYVLRSALVGWARQLMEEETARPQGPRCASCEHGSCRWIARGEPPADTTEDVSRWLLARLPWLLRHPAVEEAVGEITAATASAQRVIDRPPDHLYAGPCGGEAAPGVECDADLYARPEAPTVACGVCGTRWDVADRRRWLLDSVEDLLMPAAQIAHVLTALGWECKAERVRQWSARGRVIAHGTDAQDRPLYRVGDVRELLAAAVAKAREAQEARARRGRVDV